jgi:hypothetical protein
VVIVLAREELLVVTELESVSILPANDEENVFDVFLTVVMLDASELLLVFIEVWRLSILKAKLELFVVEVP